METEVGLLGERTRSGRERREDNKGAHAQSTLHVCIHTPRGKCHNETHHLVQTTH